MTASQRQKNRVEFKTTFPTGLPVVVRQLVKGHACGTEPQHTGDDLGAEGLEGWREEGKGLETFSMKMKL